MIGNDGYVLLADGSVGTPLPEDYSVETPILIGKFISLIKYDIISKRKMGISYIRQLTHLYRDLIKVFTLFTSSAPPFGAG